MTELLGNRRTAHHDLHLVANTRSLRRTNDLLHHAHRGRKERGTADDVAVFIDRRLHEGLRGNVGAEIDDLETLALHHHLDEVLSDVVPLSSVMVSFHPTRTL